MHRFFAARWQGRIGPSRLFWRDILFTGTIVNVCVTFATLIAAAQGSSGLAVLLHFLPLPYNAFLVMSLWRTAGRTAGQLGASIVWIAVMTLI